MYPLKTMYSFFLFLCIGCAHRVKLDSIPSGATLYYKGKELGTTPMEKTFAWWPKRTIEVKAVLPNYLPMTMNMSDSMWIFYPAQEVMLFRAKRLLGLSPRSTHEYIMIRKHGPIGSWTAEDAKNTK